MFILDIFPYKKRMINFVCLLNFTSRNYQVELESVKFYHWDGNNIFIRLELWLWWIMQSWILFNLIWWYYKSFYFPYKNLQQLYSCSIKAQFKQWLTSIPKISISHSSNIFLFFHVIDSLKSQKFSKQIKFPWKSEMKEKRKWNAKVK